MSTMWWCHFIDHESNDSNACACYLLSVVLVFKFGLQTP